MPLWLELGFEIGGAWVDRERNQFVWLITYDGPETFAERNALYWSSPARKVTNLDPDDYLVSTDDRTVEQAEGSAPVSRALGPTFDDRANQPPRLAGSLATVFCSIVLTLALLAAGYLVFLAYLTQPDGSWDNQAVTNSGFAAAAALALLAVTILLTWLCVRYGPLRTWWFAPPAVLAVAAVLRITLFAPKP